MQLDDFRDVVVAIQTGFMEMPALSLTHSQVARLWHLRGDVCQAALAALMASGFLIYTPTGRYSRSGSLPTEIASIDPLTWHMGRSPAM
jgi:hypothetical protein